MEQQPEAAVRVTGLDHVVLTAAAPEALADFYATLLNARLERTVGDFLWQLRVGDSLLDVLRVPEDDSGLQGVRNMDHFCLRVADFDGDRLRSQLEARGLTVEPAANIYGAQGFGPSVYFYDPLGNRVELKAGV